MIASERFRNLFVAGLCLLSAGDLSAAGTDPPRAPKKGPPAVTANEEITLEQTDYAGFFKALEKHKGKVVLVDVWGEF